MTKVPIVDLNDEIIMYKERDALLPKDIFRASALWITNSRGEILLAKRHAKKKHHPNKWSAAVAGTVEANESYEENIIKEAEEELGLTNVHITMWKKQYLVADYSHFTQWFVLTIDREPDSFTLGENEVAEVKWCTPESLRREVEEHPENFTPNMMGNLNFFYKK